MTADLLELEVFSVKGLQIEPNLAAVEVNHYRAAKLTQCHPPRFCDSMRISAPDHMDQGSKPTYVVVRFGIARDLSNFERLVEREGRRTERERDVHARSSGEITGVAEVTTGEVEVAVLELHKVIGIEGGWIDLSEFAKRQELNCELQLEEHNLDVRERLAESHSPYRRP